MTKPRRATSEQLAAAASLLDRAKTVAFYDKLMTSGREPAWIPATPDPVALNCYRLAQYLSDLPAEDRAIIDVPTIIELSKIALAEPEEATSS